MKDDARRPPADPARNCDSAVVQPSSGSHDDVATEDGAAATVRFELVRVGVVLRAIYLYHQPFADEEIHASY